MRYADPKLCPDCRADLPRGVPVCPTCSLLVRHPLAVALFGTLQNADTQLDQLRAASDAFHGGRLASTATGTGPSTGTSSARTAQPAPGPGSVVPPPPTPAGTLPSYPGATPGPVPPLPPQRTGVRFASVPKILLGLGAFCLLVAAIVFLAVSWSALGVGGRTAVLAGFTITAGASALLLHRAGLRIAGESLIVVALGMLALDVLGAGAAGWFGDGSGGVVAVTAGLVLAVAGAALGVLRVAGMPRLVAPQVISGIGLFIAYTGALDATDHLLLAGHALTALGVAAVLLARRVPLPVLAWSHTGAVAVVWLGTAGVALVDALDDPDLRQLWLEGSGWSLLVSAALLLVPGLVVRDHRLLLAGASCAAMLATVVATLPSVDTDAGTVGLVALGVTAAWVLTLALLPRALRAVAIAPSAVGSLILAILACVTGAVAFARWTGVDEVFGPFDLRLRSPEPVTEPLLLVPSLLVVVAFVALLAPGAAGRAVATWARVATITAGVGVAVTLASYDVLLAVPVAVLALASVVATAFALGGAGGSRTTVGFGATALAVAGAASFAALPSAALTACVAGIGFVVSVGLALVGRERALQLMAGLALAPYLALSVAGTVEAVGAGAEWLAVPVLLAVGVVAVAMPREEVELVAAAVALVTLPVSIGATADAGGLTALWLTIAGGLCCATALIHDERRQLAWVGGALLVLASWVRLVDLEVQEPEPYTLPLAAALLAVGLWRMRRNTDVGTTQALLPGLLLATVPSLLWVLGDPLSVRALVLGAACLLLTVAGAALRWSAPLVVGATVGAIVVLREIGPYAGDFPKWVWIGLAGALLTVVGITWERQLLEVRKAVGYLGRLR